MKKILTAHKIAKIKGAKISLWTNSPKLRAAKIKGFTVLDNTCCNVYISINLTSQLMFNAAHLNSAQCSMLIIKV